MFQRRIAAVTVVEVDVVTVFSELLVQAAAQPLPMPVVRAAVRIQNSTRSDGGVGGVDHPHGVGGGGSLCQKMLHAFPLAASTRRPVMAQPLPAVPTSTGA